MSCWKGSEGSVFFTASWNSTVSPKLFLSDTATQHTSPQHTPTTLQIRVSFKALLRETNGVSFSPDHKLPRGWWMWIYNNKKNGSQDEKNLRLTWSVANRRQKKKKNDGIFVLPLGDVGCEGLKN